MNYKNQIKPKKKYSQNFLINREKINEIISKIKVESFDALIEIGPGKGAITDEIVKLKKDLLLIEIDNNLVSYLKDKYKFYENVFILANDFLKCNLNNIIKKYLKDKQNIIIFSNLPYNITSPIIFKIINEKAENINKCLFMVQKEYGERLYAKPKSKSYNSLTIIVNLFFRITKIIDLEPNDFYPKPKVQSVFLELNPYQNKQLSNINKDEYFMFLKNIFTHPRKNIVNNMKIIIKNKDIINQIIKEEKLKNNTRAQELSEEKLFSLFQNIKNKGVNYEN